MSVNITIRLEDAIGADFKEMARERGISQGELVENLVKEERLREKNQKNGIIDLQNNEADEIKLILKECNDYKKVYKEAKIFKFKGCFIAGLAEPREVYEFSKDAIKSLLSGRVNSNGPIDTPCPVGMKGYRTLYQYCVYKDLTTQEYIIYEFFGVSNLMANKLEVNLKRLTIVKSLKDIICALQPYVSVAETEDIEFKLAEDISDNAEMLEQYVHKI